MRYMTNVRGYIEANIIIPPRTSKSVFYIKKGKTYLWEKIELVKKEV
jgi:hypothetical protein